MLQVGPEGTDGDALFLLPTAYCPLPTAYCLLPTAYCLLPTAYCFPLYPGPLG